MMHDNFITFEGAPNGRRGERVRVTLGPSKTFLMSDSAWKLFGEPVAVELAFDPVDRKIALRPCSPERRNAFRVARRSSGSHRVVYAGAFLTHFNIDPQHTVLFDDPEVTPEGAIILNLTRTTRVSKGSR